MVSAGRGQTLKTYIVVNTLFTRCCRVRWGWEYERPPHNITADLVKCATIHCAAFRNISGVQAGDLHTDNSYLLPTEVKL